MNIADIISKDAVLDNLQAANKRELVQILSERVAALSGLDERAVFDAVWERENLGSTGYGEGVAFPHARIEGLDKVCGMFARLEEPVDFDSLDGKPVDFRKPGEFVHVAAPYRYYQGMKSRQCGYQSVTCGVMGMQDVRLFAAEQLFKRF